MALTAVGDMELRRFAGLPGHLASRRKVMPMQYKVSKAGLGLSTILKEGENE